MWEKEKWEGHGRNKKRYTNREVSPKRGRKVLFSPGDKFTILNTSFLAITLKQRAFKAEHIKYLSMFSQGLWHDFHIITSAMSEQVSSDHVKIIPT